MLNLKNHVLMFLTMFGIWMLINNSLATEVLVSGAGIALILSLAFCRSCSVFSTVRISPRSFLYLILYALVFFFELLRSNLDVIKRVLSSSLPLKPGIVEVKTRLKSQFGRMLLANSITLTPGTLTVEVKEESFFIHWIDVANDDKEAASEAIVKKFEKYLEVIYG